METRSYRFRTFWYCTVEFNAEGRDQLSIKPGWRLEGIGKMHPKSPWIYVRHFTPGMGLAKGYVPVSCVYEIDEGQFANPWDRAGEASPTVETTAQAGPSAPLLSRTRAREQSQPFCPICHLSFPDQSEFQTHAVMVHPERLSELFGGAAESIPACDLPEFRRDVPYQPGEIENLPAEAFSGLWRGIQGENNSCYIDSTLYSMFCHSTAFDKLLTTELVEPAAKRLQTTLKDKIVNVLRSHRLVQRESMAEFRILLNQWFPGNDVRTGRCEEGDVVDFVQVLLKVLQPENACSPLGEAPAHFSLERPSKPFHIETILTAPAGTSSATTVHDTLKFSQEFTSLVHQCTPEVLMVHFPRERDARMNFVVPSPRLSFMGSVPKEPIEYELFSVLSIGTSHYVSFSRVHTEQGKNTKWLFFDSMATRQEYPQPMNVPQITEEGQIESWCQEFGRPDCRDVLEAENIKKEAPDSVRRLFSHAYLCFYRKVPRQ